MKKKIWMIVLCCIGFFSFAGDISVTLQQKGTLNVDNTTFSLGFYNPQWSFSSHNVKIKQAEQGIREGVFPVSGGTFHVSERLTPVAADQWKLNIKLRTEKPIAANQIFFGTTSSLLLTSGIVADGKPLAFAEKTSGKMLHALPAGTHRVEIPMGSGVLEAEGQFQLWFQDNRRWGHNDASIRFLFTPCQGKISTAELDLNLKWRDYSGIPLKMAEANSFLKDETAGDGRGGWTDQGNNDMRQLPLGKRQFAGLPFSVTERCIGLYYTRTPFYPKEITVSGEGQSGKYLYLLHAEGWEPTREKSLGRIRFRYADGSTKWITLDSGKDCGNFWQPRNRPNAVVAWKGHNGTSPVGMYVTKIRTAGKPLRDITFQTAGNSSWLIAGMTLSNDSVPMYNAVPVVMAANSEWRPMQFFSEVIPGSILDFSMLADAPAGKYGPVRNIDGHFAFEKKPGKPVRFYGGNLCYNGNFITRQQAKTLARGMRERGYNLLRFHHFERDLIRKDHPVSTEIDPAKMDRMDGVFAEAKAQGIYMTLDLFISRPLKKGEIEEFPDRAVQMNEFKQLVFASPSALENWKAFARNFLTHVNPYTGLAWKDDPALISINLVNEGNIQLDPAVDSPVNRLLRKRYPEWLKANNLSDPQGKNVRLYRRYIVDLYRKTYSEMADFLRSLGVKAMLHDQNMLSSVPLTLMRQNYDLVDNHFYHSHPAFPETPWRLPLTFSTSNSAQSLAAPLGNMFSSRIFGKPFTITEWDYCNPAPFVMEGALVTGAYAALNDWDCLCHFQILSGPWEMKEFRIGLFSLYCDPVRNLADRIGALLFLRGDVRPSPACRTILVPTDYLEQNPKEILYPRLTQQLGLLERTGVVLWDGDGGIPAETSSIYLLPEVSYRNLPANVPTLQLSGDAHRTETEALRRGFLPPEAGKGIFRSVTGEIELNRPRNRVSVVTPNSEAFSLGAHGVGTGKFLSVRNRQVPGVFLAASMTGEPLKNSGRILLLHLTQVRNTGMKFRDDSCSLLEDYGKVPQLLRQAAAEISLAAPENSRLYACAGNGARLFEIPLKRGSDGKSRFLADNFPGKDAILVYELVRGE